MVARRGLLGCQSYAELSEPQLRHTDPCLEHIHVILFYKYVLLSLVFVWPPIIKVVQKKILKQLFVLNAHFILE